MSDVMMSDVFTANMVFYFHIRHINFISTFILFANQK